MTISQQDRLEISSLYIFVSLALYPLITGVGHEFYAPHAASITPKQFWDDVEHHIPAWLRLSMWTFGVFWLLQYSLIASASYLLWVEGDISDYENVEQYRATIILLLIYILSNISWYTMLFKIKTEGGATAVSSITWAVGIALLSLTGNGKQWISFSILLAMQLWISYILLITLFITSRGTGKVKKTPNKYLKM